MEFESNLTSVKGCSMLQIRWHSRAGQGAVTGAKSLGAVVAKEGKFVQAFAFYGSAKRGTAMTAYNRIDDKVVKVQEKYMIPDYVLVIDPALIFSVNFTENCSKDTVYLLTTHLSKDELISKLPMLKDKKFYIIDAIKISKATIGKSVPNAPMLGALMKVSGMFSLEDFQNNMKSTLKKFPQKIIDANMEALKVAYNEVK